MTSFPSKILVSLSSAGWPALNERPLALPLLRGCVGHADVKIAMTTNTTPVPPAKIIRPFDIPTVPKKPPTLSVRRRGQGEPVDRGSGGPV